MSYIVVSIYAALLTAFLWFVWCSIMSYLRKGRVIDSAILCELSLRCASSCQTPYIRALHLREAAVHAANAFFLCRCYANGRSKSFAPVPTCPALVGPSAGCSSTGAIS